MFYKEKQSHDSCSFDRSGSLTLLTSVKASIASGFYFSVVTGDVSEEGKIFIVDVIDVVECLSGRFFRHGLND